MSRRKRLLFVGPDPDTVKQHPGGQLTAAKGIADAARLRGYLFETLDTAVSNFPPPGMGQRILAGASRFATMFRMLRHGDAAAVVLFVGARFSLLERAALGALARLAGVRSVFCIRDGGFYPWMRSSPVMRLLVQLLLRVPKRIVVQGTRLRDDLIDLGISADRVVVIRNWVPDGSIIEDTPVSAPTSGPLRFIFVAWLVPEKGIRELVEAFGGLHRSHAATLEIVGGGTLEEELRNATKNMPDVNIHGWRSASEVHRHLRIAHVFVLPTYFEGFPNALLEAMAAGLPAVCCDVGAISDSLQSGVNGYLVPPRNVTALRAALQHYLDNPSIVATQSSETLQRVRRLHGREENLGALFSHLSADIYAGARLS